MNKPKKLQGDFLTKFTLIKKFWARAHAKPHIAVKTQKSSNFGLGGRIFYRRARGSARAPIFFSDLDSPQKIDDFCTKNELKIFKTRN